MTPSSKQNRPDGWKFEISYARLPEAIYARLNPVPARTPKLVVFSGNRIPEDAEPVVPLHLKLAELKRSRPV